MFGNPSNTTVIEDVTRWAQEDARIWPDVSACRFYGECNAAGILNGKHCAMSYIGRRYGNGTTFRLAIVGMDHGELERADVEERRKGVERSYQFGGEAFNPHYAGVVKTASAVLGMDGEYCSRECSRSCQKSCAPASPCVLDRIAQPNVVKCVPDTANDRNSKTTSTMWANCAHHLVAELRALRPQLVVFHGVKARWAVPAAIRPDALRVVESVTDRRGAVLYEWSALGAHLLFLKHPSRHWLAKQWDPVVVPALGYLRAKGLIPA